jgi:hypothetical protein
MQPSLSDGLAVSFPTLALAMNGLNLASFGHNTQAKTYLINRFKEHKLNRVLN